MKREGRRIVLVLVTGLLFAILIYLFIFGKQVMPYTGALISFFGYPWRSRGSGLAVLLPGESITHEVPLTKRVCEPFNNDFEAANDQQVDGSSNKVQ